MAALQRALRVVADVIAPLELVMARVRALVILLIRVRYRTAEILVLLTA